MAENTKAGQDVGDPVAAEDEDADDVLTYTLGDTDADGDSSPSTRATGQIMTKGTLDYEMPDKVYRSATATRHRHGHGHGPGGRTRSRTLTTPNSDTVTVTITVTDK